MTRQLHPYEPNLIKVSTYDGWQILPIVVYGLSVLLVIISYHRARKIFTHVVRFFSAETFYEVYTGNDDELTDITRRPCRLSSGIIIPANAKENFYIHYSRSLPTQLLFLIYFAFSTIFVEHVYEESCSTYNLNGYANNSYYSCSLKNENGSGKLPKPEEYCSLNSTNPSTQTIICAQYFYDKTKFIILLAGIYGLHKLMALIFVFLIRWDQWMLRLSDKVALKLTVCKRNISDIMYVLLSLGLFYAPLFLLYWSVEGMTIVYFSTLWTCWMISMSVVIYRDENTTSYHQSFVAVIPDLVHRRPSDGCYGCGHSEDANIQSSTSE
jgi:hypothetical protein